MFVKLLKNEFRATRNAMMVLCFTALGAGILGGLAMGWLFWLSTQQVEMNALIVLCTLVMAASLIALGVCGVGVFLMLVERFFRSRFTDEAYLTFTLPVNTHQVLLSSLVSSGLNMLITFVTVFLSFGIMMLIGCSFMAGFWDITWEMLPELWNSLCNSMSWEIAGYLALVVADMLAGLAYELVIVMLAVTIGALIARKHKILAAIGVYYGINMVLSIFSVTAMTSGVLFRDFRFVLISTGLMWLAIAVAGYFLMHYLVNRKLNLP